MPTRMTRPTLLVLRFLLDRFQDSVAGTWGFEIASNTGLKGGTVYPLLSRLAAEGWVESYWEDSTAPGPRRRMYRMTATGAREAAAVLRARGEDATATELRWT